MGHYPVVWRVWVNTRSETRPGHGTSRRYPIRDPVLPRRDETRRENSRQKFETFSRISRHEFYTFFTLKNRFEQMKLISFSNWTWIQELILGSDVCMVESIAIVPSILGCNCLSWIISRKLGISFFADPISKTCVGTSFFSFVGKLT